MPNGKKMSFKKIINIIFNNWEKLICVLGFVAYVMYVLYMYVEAPIESYISKFYLIDLFYSDNLQFKDLLIPYTENGMLASNILFLLNLKYFGFSVLVENITNAILVAIVGYVGMVLFPKKMVEKRNAFYYIAIIIMGAFLFTFMQQGGGGMSLQVRFGYAAFVVVSYMLDKVLHEDCGCIYYLFTILIIFMSINLFGSAYSFAAIPFVFLLIFSLIIKQKKIQVKNLGIALAYICSGLLYFFEYGFLSAATQGDAAVGGGFIIKLGMFLSNLKDVFEGFLFWCASSVLGRASIEEGKISPTMYLAVGVFIFAIIIVATFLYFKSRLYDITYMPVLWFGYYFTLYFIISAGRLEVINELGTAWVTSSWYTVHTKLIPVAIIGIFIYSLDNGMFKLKLGNVCICISIIFMFFLVAFGSYCCALRLPSEKIWMQSKQSYFYVESIDELPVDETGMTPLFQDRDTSWEAIEKLRKYHLSLFRD